jgi:hypothetical protein
MVELDLLPQRLALSLRIGSAMAENHARAAIRRTTTRGGRRRNDTTDANLGTGRLAASVLWHLPDNTRCWVMQHKGRLMVRVSRDDRDLRIEVFDTEADVAAQADAWCLEYGAVQTG